ncbi:MAG: carbohydrate binding family 9 domain-containing protein [Burkholderiaceae bacterium]|nr:carbohydrate binding family 9 domain-containing protein [Burkholderiaceae bacterium]
MSPFTFLSGRRARGGALAALALLPALPLAGPVAAAEVAAAAPAAAAPLAEFPPLFAVRLGAGEQIRLDGRLDHLAWQRAPAFEDFAEKDPQFGAPPAQRTRVQVLFDDRAIYVGITAFDDAPDRIRAPLVRHDQVFRTQDFVVVFLDAIGQRRAAQFFRVGASGSLGDGMYTADDDTEDFAPDFDWDAAVQQGDGGWTAVLRLPFASLRFSEDPGAVWRMLVARRLPREQFHLFTSAPVPREAPSFIQTMPRLEGVQLPPQHQFLTLRPSLTARHDSASGTHWDLSLDAKWRASAEWVVDATLNPDFSQVALDVPQLRGNERYALQLSEKRPFFFESSDLLRSPTEALYTRSLTQPRWGLRGSWRSAGLAGTAMAIDDRGGGLVLLPGPYGTDYAEQPGSQAWVARLRADRPGLQGGLVAAARRYDDGRGSNEVVGPDLNWSFADGWRLHAQWLHARSSALPDAQGELRRAAAVDADRVYLRSYYQGDALEAHLGVDDIGAGFRADSGFVGQSGVREWKGWLARAWRGQPGLHRIGLNEFWLNLELQQVRDRRTGEVIQERLRPGLWVNGPRNFEAWLEWYGHERQRLAAAAPLLAERYTTLGFIHSPAPWLSHVEANLTQGRLIDADQGVLRPGRRSYLFMRLRPLPRLELEPTHSTARLWGGERPGYRESALQWLAVWHVDARNHLRVITQRSRLERGSQVEPAQRVASLTWSRRHSVGTVLHVGASRSQAGGPEHRVTEGFVKLQVDLGELRAGW